MIRKVFITSLPYTQKKNVSAWAVVFQQLESIWLGCSYDFFFVKFVVGQHYNESTIIHMCSFLDFVPENYILNLTNPTWISRSVYQNGHSWSTWSRLTLRQIKVEKLIIMKIQIIFHCVYPNTYNNSTFGRSKLSKAVYFYRINSNIHFHFTPPNDIHKLKNTDRQHGFYIKSIRIREGKSISFSSPFKIHYQFLHYIIIYIYSESTNDTMSIFILSYSMVGFSIHYTLCE